MSVRSCMLAVLTLGQAYGLQLHSEIEARTARSGQINAGQIYSTLNRLVDAGLVAVAEQKPAQEQDGQSSLPRYELTADGASEAHRWIAGDEPERADWTAMVEHVLLVSSLPDTDPQPLLSSYRRLWQRLQVEATAGSSTGLPPSGPTRAAAAADTLLAAGALAWLQETDAAIGTGTLSPRPLSNERPRRGRRPSLSH